MTNIQILWSVNTGLLAILFFFVKTWFTKMDSKLESKLDEKVCIERHDAIDKTCTALFKHKHAPTYGEGKGGEVIIP